VYRLSKAIAGLVVGLGRLDALVSPAASEKRAPGPQPGVSQLGFLLTEDAQATPTTAGTRRTHQSVGPVLAWWYRRMRNS